MICEQLIAHYHNKTDGLLCKLATPCERTGFRRRVRGEFFNDQHSDITSCYFTDV